VSCGFVWRALASTRKGPCLVVPFWPAQKCFRTRRFAARRQRDTHAKKTFWEASARSGRMVGHSYKGMGGLADRYPEVGLSPRRVPAGFFQNHPFLIYEYGPKRCPIFSTSSLPCTAGFWNVSDSLPTMSVAANQLLAF
jgi:hypothetical protein